MSNVDAKGVLRAPDSIQDEVDDIEFLKRGLLFGEGFQLYVGAAPSVDAREAVIQKLRATEGLDVRAVYGDDKRGLAVAITSAFGELKGSSRRPVVVITDIEQEAEGEASLFRRLNEQRNELIQRSPGAIVVLGSAYAINVLRRVAPDMWSVRAADLDLAAALPRHETRDIETALSYELSPMQPASEGERERLEEALRTWPTGHERGLAAFRLAGILSIDEQEKGRTIDLFLQAANDVAEPWVAALARINAGRLLLARGDIVAARQALTEALQSPAMRDLSLRSYANLHMGEILGRSGEGSAAVALLRLVATADSDMDLAAYAHLNIADIVAEQGDLHAALAECDDAERVARALHDRELLAVVLESQAYFAARAGQRERVDVSLRRLAEQTSMQRAYAVVSRLEAEQEARAAQIARGVLVKLMIEQEERSSNVSSNVGDAPKESGPEGSSDNPHR